MRVPVLVVGGGHAGCEAAAASARMGVETLLVTTDPSGLGKMSCNPAIGGVGKGHLVREIDAMGGLMGRLADSAAIQYKVLNRRKGPAVWGLRAQEDRKLYVEAVRKILGEIPRLEVVAGTLVGVRVKNGRVIGVTVDTIGEMEAEAVVIAAGTFLNGKIHVGREISPGGRRGEPPSLGITEQLSGAGLKADRFKTGTPPRVEGETIDTSCCGEEWGDEVPIPFSNFGPPSSLPRRPCWLTGTTAKTHRVIRKNIDKAPLYSGQIQAVGPRSCPSVEDKVMRFPNRETHQIYIEPEGLDTTECYLNGLSTSFPREVQEEIVASVPGLENARITKYGYAIEYDYFPPQQLNARLEVKKIKGLYLAGQINGTTGYEEAGAQGLMAGINAALSVKGLQPLILSRSRAYIGVMIDDLVLKGVEFPYRIYSSRAESRLFLRNDNSDIRLSGIGRELGLLGKKQYQGVLTKEGEIEFLREKLKNTRWSGKTLEEALGESGERFQKSQSLEVVLRRPGVTIGTLLEKGFGDIAGSVSDSAIREVEMSVKYEGYIRRGEIEIERLNRLESVSIPDGLDFFALQNLTAVSRERLNEIRPRTLGQVARIPGMSPNDVSVIAIAVENLRRSASVAAK